MRDPLSCGLIDRKYYIFYMESEKGVFTKIEQCIHIYIRDLS